MAKQKKKKKRRGFRLFVKIQLVLIVLVLAGLAFYFFGGYAKKISDLKSDAYDKVHSATDETFRSSQTSLVYDTNGNLISVLKGEKDMYYLEYEEIPSDVCSAIISIEDKKFYQHHGVDFKGILRAVKAMIENGRVTQGASTITQQLARNIFLTQEKTWERKIEEIFIATEMERLYTKNQILEYYLNNIYFGNGYYGIQAASKGYFNTEVKNLDLSQIAFLCAIPNRPTLYDPVTHIDNTIKRRNRILNQMKEDGKISAEVCKQAKEETITLNRPTSVKNNYVETYTYYCATRALMAQEGFEFKNTFQSATEKERYEEEYDDMYDAWVTGKDEQGYPTWRKGVRYHQVSTDEVYGSLGAEGFFTENTPLCPHSPYSASKTSADMVVMAYHDTYRMPVTITRCSNNYGPYHFPEKLIPLIIKNILEGKPLPVYGDGSNVRDWLYVEDHCKAIDLVVRKGVEGEVYNVGGHNEKTNLEIVKLTIATIRRLMEEKPEYRAVLKKQVKGDDGQIDISWINEGLITFVKDRLGHDQRYAIDPAKITEALGWYPETKFETGIVKTIEWYLNNQDWVEEVTSGDYQKYYERMYGKK